MIAEFLTWWGQQLASLVPERTIARGRDAAVVALEGDALTVTVRRHGREGTLGRFALDAAGLTALRATLGPNRPPIELHLPPRLMLDHAVALPLAAEGNPGRVLGYEMDRLTPFKADELFWTWSLIRRDRGRNQVHVNVTLVPRATVVPTLHAMGMAGLAPAALVGASGQRIALGARRDRRERLALRAGYALAGLCIVLAITGTALPFALQSLQARRVEKRIASLRPAVDRAEALRRGLASASLGVDVLAAQRDKVGDPLLVLAALTEVLPDDTVLTDLTMRARTLTITGASAAAARLIPALAADPDIDSPAFTAPVTRNETTRKEGFTIRAEAAP